MKPVVPRVVVSTLFAFAAVSAACGSTQVTERISTVADRTSVGLTIYNAGQSLVHDRRRVALDAGTTPVAWRDVSANIDPTSAVIDDRTMPDATRVLEQNFDYDLLTPESLLAKYVGRTVTVVHDGGNAGHPRIESATLLSNNNGLVLKYPDRIETGLYDSHIVFPGIPDDLRDRPTLVLDLDNAKGGNDELDLSYMTDGLGWRADYVGVVSPNEDRLDLSGLVTLTNTTGTTFSDAHVQLVAGNVNVAIVPPMARQFTDTARSEQPSVQQENFFEYHLYTLARPTTVANAQTKQVSLLSAKNVPIRKTLELRGSDSYYSNATADLGAKLNVGVYVTFANRGGDLGVPLPGGIVRLYKTDSRGTSQFLGSDTIDHTPRDQDVRLHVGDSFDVTANKKQTDFKGLGCTYESSYAVAVSNAKDQTQTVLVVEPIPGTWSILSENVPHVKTSSSTATWTLNVPSRKTVTLDYTAHVSVCF